MNKNTIKIFVSAVVAVGILATIVVTVMNIQNGKAEKTNWVEIYAGIGYAKFVDNIPSPMKIELVYSCGKILIFKTKDEKYYAANPSGNTLRYNGQHLAANLSTIMEFKLKDGIFGTDIIYKNQCGISSEVFTTNARSITIKANGARIAIVEQNSGGISLYPADRSTIEKNQILDFEYPVQLVQRNRHRNTIEFYVFHQQGSNTMILKVSKCSGSEDHTETCFEED